MQKAREATFKAATEVLGIQENIRLGFFGQLLTEMAEDLHEFGYNWSGQLVTLRHKDGYDISSVVEMIFNNRTCDITGGMSTLLTKLILPDETKWEEEPIYSIDLDPKYCVINEELLCHVVQTDKTVEYHDQKLRQLLETKRFVATDLGKCLIQLEDAPNDPDPIVVPFQVLFEQ